MIISQIEFVFLFLPNKYELMIFKRFQFIDSLGYKMPLSTTQIAGKFLQTLLYRFGEDWAPDIHVIHPKFVEENQEMLLGISGA